MYLKLKKSIEETMKKQIFLLVVGLLFASPIIQASCSTTCSTTCTPCATVATCNNLCTPEHGKTFLQVTPHFQAASPELASCFNSNVLHNLDRDDKHGAFEVTVFGGKSTKCSQAGAYYLPYGHSTLTFDGSVTGDNLKVFARVAAESVVQATGATTAGDQIGFDYELSTGANLMASDQATYKFDGNKDTSKILPWNFGITFAALFEPLGVTGITAGTSGVDNAAGSGLVTNPAFKSTISPTLKYSHVGAGLALRYHFSDDKNGFFGLISTAVQNVKSKFCLNETPVTAKTALNATNFPQKNPDPLIADNVDLMGIYGDQVIINVTTPNLIVSNEFVSLPAQTANVQTPVGSIYETYLVASPAVFPNDVDGTVLQAPANVTEAFAQSAWTYGKVNGCGQKITRLADIELRLGYQWMCGDCASTNWYLGVVIPTGNKGGATYIAPAVVGNGQHAGIMTGSCTEVMLSDETDYSAWYRLDVCARYLFRNTQKRSFDLLGNEWSRYMMVWANEAAYSAAVDAANTLVLVATAGTDLVMGAAQHGYTPGINVFTTDFYVKPQFQLRLNQAVYFQGEHFRAELGWNVFARQKDCIQLACDWTAKPAFADASYSGGIGLNNNRTIYNDSQTTVYNAVDSLLRVNAAGTSTTGDLVTLAGTVVAATDYDDFQITSDQIDYNSMATPGAIVNTPYLSLGYAWDSEHKPQFSIGGSYEFTTSNRALNQWLLWGKFELAF